jgi:capsular exopolysaccharide synthesis family protein
VSRIYDAMKRGASLEASQRSLVTAGRKTAPLVDRVAESYQRVLHAIQSSRGADSGATILFVSANHGEGTSTVARGVAALLAREGLAKVVLVDANLRTPSQHEAFGLERIDGLTEVVTRGLAIDRAVRNGTGNQPPVMTAGRPTSHPAGILAAPELRATIERLRSKYDWVVIDGPPATVYSDAGMIAPLTDGVVLVIEAERTRWEVADRARGVIEDSGGRVVGAVLSRRRFHIPAAVYRIL